MYVGSTDLKIMNGVKSSRGISPGFRHGHLRKQHRTVSLFNHAFNLILYLVLSLFKKIQKCTTIIDLIKPRIVHLVASEDLLMSLLAPNLSVLMIVAKTLHFSL